MSSMGAPASGASRDPLDIETGQVSGRLVTISGEEIGHFIQPQNQASIVASQVSSGNHDWPRLSSASTSNGITASDHQGNSSIHAAELIVGDKQVGVVQGQVREGGQQVQPQQPPNSLEYRIADVEVLQLTRVPQAEAMRLVNSGATVIHVADPQQDSNLHNPGSSNMPGPSGSNRTQPQQPQQPAEPQATTAAASTAAPQQMMIFNQTSNQQQHQQQQRASLNTNYDLSAELVQVLVNRQQS